MRLFEISLNWAEKHNAERPYNFDMDEYIVLKCNIEDVMSNVSSDTRLDINSIDGGENAIGNRLSTAINHFKNGEPMDYPEVGYNDYTNKIDITNGRHRMLAAYKLGYEFIPMFVYRPTLEKFKQVIRTQ